MTGAALRRRAKQAKRATSSSGCEDAEKTEIAEPKSSTSKGV